MFQLYNYLCVIFIFEFSESLITKKPDFVNTCQIKKPEFVNCSTHAVQILFDEIPSGISEIGLDPLDPLKVPIIKILQGTGPVNVNASLTNVTVIGFGDTHILLNKVDPVTHDFYTELHLPRLRIDGNYKLLGRILVIPLRGAGMCWFDAKNLDITVKNVVELIEHDGYHFFKITGIKVKFTIGGLSLYMGNLFDGIKALGMNVFESKLLHTRSQEFFLNPMDAFGYKV